MTRTTRQNGPASQDADACHLTPHTLLRHFGGQSAAARQGVSRLFVAVEHADAAAFALWTPFGRRWAGRAADRLPSLLAKLSIDYNARGNPSALLFAMQTYYAMAVETVAARFGRTANVGLAAHATDGKNPFAWPHAAKTPEVAAWLEALNEDVAQFQTVAALLNDSEECDLFKPLYQNLFPRPLRRLLGEYYTPDWLAAHVLDQVGYDGLAHARLLDPACGSGTFLMMALRRLVGRTAERGDQDWETLRRGDKETRNAAGSTLFEKQNVKSPRLLVSPSPSLPVSLSPRLPISQSPRLPVSPSPVLPVGFDLNPLAVLTARANYAIAIADHLPPGVSFSPPVFWHDSILDRGEANALDFRTEGQQFDFVVGNPPWIAWDNLPPEDREATKPLWERFGLFSLSGNEARHGGGKKDLSMLMLYAVAERFLKNAGRLGMVITQTLFQNKGAGDGFRRFRLGDGPSLRVLRVDDLSRLRPFDDAANWTSVVVLEKGAATVFPVPYFKWGERRLAAASTRRCASGEIKTITACLARPIDPQKPTSPWLIEEPADAAQCKTHAAKKPAAAVLPADYTAHLGANSGGANGVYWVEILEKSSAGVRIRNLAGRGKRAVETVECVIEPDLLHPLLRWGDIRRYSARPSAHLVLSQDPATRAGVPESVMREKYPRTLAYLERFHDLLVERSAFRRYQERGPFYAMYNVGPYTVAPIKVVWRRMDRRINAAVVEGVAVEGIAVEGEGPQSPVPQETCVLVACDTSAEAHYLCAMLNSRILNDRVVGHSVASGKSFGTPGMFQYLPLRRFDSADRRHVELARLSREAHAAATTEKTSEVACCQEAIDRIAQEVWTLG